MECRRLRDDLIEVYNWLTVRGERFKVDLRGQLFHAGDSPHLEREKGTEVDTIRNVERDLDRCMDRKSLEGHGSNEGNSLSLLGRLAWTKKA